MERGVPVSIPEPRASRLVFYRRKWRLLQCALFLLRVPSGVRGDPVAVPEAEENPAHRV